MPESLLVLQLDVDNLHILKRLVVFVCLHLMRPQVFPVTKGTG